jgi:hypothetical protein
MSKRAAACALSSLSTPVFKVCIAASLSLTASRCGASTHVVRWVAEGGRATESTSGQAGPGGNERVGTSGGERVE